MGRQLSGLRRPHRRHLWHAKCYPHGYVRLESEINAIATDPAFKNGDYTTPPTKGSKPSH